MLTHEQLLHASLHNQFLLAKAPTREVVSELCGLQAQFANNPQYALRLRAHDFDPVQWGAGLVKTWTFRHTLHVVRADELGLFLSARGVQEKWNDDWGISRRVKPRWAAFLCDKIEEGVSGREALKQACRDAGMTPDLLENVFHGWGGLLKELCQRGRIAYDWGTAKRFVRCPPFASMDREKARATLMERYFRRLGPATMADCATFMGWRRKEFHATLAKHPLPLQSAPGPNGAEYHWLGNLPTTGDLPSCVFLTGFDQMLMAYRDRSRLLDDEHRREVVTNTGIIHPTILVNSRLRARWRMDNGRLAITPFAPLTLRQRKAIATTAKERFPEMEVAWADWPETTPGKASEGSPKKPIPEGKRNRSL